jgi:UDP-glucose 4-epimerase
MTVQLLDKLREAGVNKFVFSSSAAVYGIPANGIAEDDATDLQPINPYGRGKLMIENILKDYYVAYGLSSVSLRYFNAAGADADAEIGELREDESHIIPLAIEAAYQNQEFKLFGTDFDTPDGTCVRDYVHVVDLARAIKISLEKQNLRYHKIYNLGSGKGSSVLEVIAEAEKVILSEIVKNDGPAKDGDSAYLVAESKLANTELGWISQFSLNKIIEDSYAFNQALNLGI